MRKPKQPEDNFSSSLVTPSGVKRLKFADILTLVIKLMSYTRTDTLNLLKDFEKECQNSKCINTLIKVKYMECVEFILLKFDTNNYSLKFAKIVS